MSGVTGVLHPARGHAAPVTDGILSAIASATVLAAIETVKIAASESFLIVIFPSLCKKIMWGLHPLHYLLLKRFLSFNFYT